MLTGKTKRGVELWRLNGVSRAEKRIAWVVVGDGTQVAIYELDPRGNSLRTVRRLEFPQGTPRVRHAFGEETSFHEFYVDEMARRLGQLLGKARGENLFTHLTLIAEPRLMGHLKLHIDHRTQDRISAIIEKDYARMSVPALLDLLKPHR